MSSLSPLLEFLKPFLILDKLNLPNILFGHIYMMTHLNIFGGHYQRDDLQWIGNLSLCLFHPLFSSFPSPTFRANTFSQSLDKTGTAGGRTGLSRGRYSNIWCFFVKNQDYSCLAFNDGKQTIICLDHTINAPPCKETKLKQHMQQNLIYVGG